VLGIVIFIFPLTGIISTGVIISEITADSLTWLGLEVIFTVPKVAPIV